jgi:hypothetical protein
MLQGGFTSVLGAKSREELLKEVVDFTRRLGFETVTATAVVDHFRGESEFFSVENTPSGFLDVYEDASMWVRDPVLQHCKRASVPIIWNQDTYVTAGQGEKFEIQAKFGYKTGIALALHLPEGKHFFMGVDRDKPLPGAPEEVTRMVADLQLFAVHAQDAAMRVLVPTPVQHDLPTLTPRELESLRWTMEGKTAWEVGGILGISERTAVLHVNNANAQAGVRE